MSIRTTVYKILSTDQELAGLLATKPDLYGEGPAIYETWAAPDTPMPYINLGFSFAPGQGLFKRLGSADLDIFVENYDTITIERIQNRVIELIDILLVRDPDEGPVRFYLDNETEIPEDTESIVHWNLTFSVIHWRQGFINKTIGRL